MDEKYKQGEKEGIKKGKEKYYGKGIVEGESEEYKRWTKAGHNDRCFKSTVIRDDASTQTDAPSDVQAWLGLARPEKIQAWASGLQKPKPAQAMGLGRGSHTWYVGNRKTPKSWSRVPKYI